jgi:hypothetical protein
MSTQSPTTPGTDLDDPARREADAVAVLEQFATGTPVDPAIAERVRAGAERVTEDIRRVRGLVDDDTFQSLLDDEA